jgi:hypothetical protein
MSSRNNASSNASSNTLNNEQRRLLNFYINTYNSIHNDIERLHNMLENVLTNINSIARNIDNTVPSHDVHLNRNTGRNSYTNTHTNTNAHRSNNNVYSRTSHPEMNYVSPFAHTNSNMQYIPSNRNTNSNNTTSNNTTNNRNNRWENTPLLDLFNQVYLNVPVTPSRQQIDNATRTVIYQNIIEPLNNRCPIGLEPFQAENNVIQIIPCGHLFNEESINLWFRSNVRCPVCRYDIRDYVPPEQSTAAPVSSSSIETSITQTEETTSTPITPITPTPRPINTTNPSIPISASLPNLRVNRNSQTQEVDSISYDLTDDNLINSFTNIANDLLFGNRNTSREFTTDNQRVLYDPSNNIIMFETYLRNPRNP